MPTAALSLIACNESNSPSTIEIAQSAAVAGAPVITAQPGDAFLIVGQKFAMSVTATGTAPLQYQWQRNNTNVPGANAASYSKVGVIADSGAKWRCVVANGSGAVVANNQPGYSGTGFADYIDAANDYVQWTVNVANAGSFSLRFLNANGGATSRPLKITVNGTQVNGSLAFPSPSPAVRTFSARPSGAGSARPGA